MSCKSGTIKLKAPAKINLTLHILGRRPDGYHELSTRMQKLDLSDEITLVLREKPGISLNCSAAGVPEDDSNLAWKAAEAFFRKVSPGGGYGVGIHLVKNIPVAAGLGGGSSDAGTILKGLNILFKAGLSEQQLVDMARPLGADVPFFATDYNAVLATGVGERMIGVDSLKDCRVILVNPGCSVSTRWAFENYALTRVDKTFKKKSFQKNPADPFCLSELHNDLEKVTVRRYPVIYELKEKLAESGAVGVLMSGSGPTVFGIFQEVGGVSEIDLNMIATDLRGQYGEKVFITQVAGAWPSGEGTGF